VTTSSLRGFQEEELVFRSARGSLFRMLLLRYAAGRVLGRGRVLPGGPVNVLAAGNQRMGGFAIAGFGAAVVGLFVSPLAGFFLALLAILLGTIGFVRSVSPRVRGGLLSIAAIALGVLGVVVNLLKGIF
jgi:hypothetical protein